jgi:hypothetical protein
VRTFRSTAAARGHARSKSLAVRFGSELRIARVATGLTQAQLGAIAQVTQQEVSLAELGAASVSFSARCRLAAGCGHELGWRLYPVATVRLRDSGQLSIAQVIATSAHPSWQVRLEVPVAAGDARAADLVLTGAQQTLHIEVERAIVDLQAQLRSAQLKRQELAKQETRPIQLILAVPDMPSTRQRLAPFGELIGRALPVPSRRIWHAIRHGEALDGDGILFVRRAPAD